MKTVTCFGSGKGEPGEPMYEKMREVGKLLAKNGVRVVTGGYGGSGMEAPLRGAKEGQGFTLGYTLSYKEKGPNQYLSKVIVVGDDLSFEENTNSTQYILRLERLTHADGFIVDPTDQTFGTLNEFVAVVTLNEKAWRESPKPIAVLIPDPQSMDLMFFQLFRQVVHLGNKATTTVMFASTPQETVDWVLKRKSPRRTRSFTALR